MTPRGSSPPTDVVPLADGRVLAFDLHGDPDGMPIVALHGTPGSRLQLSAAGPVVADLGIRLIVPDRPGYGLSTHDPRRTLTTWPADLEALVDHLGLGRFLLAGLSGGGPHALAAAWALPDRVEAAAVIGGVAPLVPRDRRLPPDRLVVRQARRSERRARWLFEIIVRAGRRNPGRALDRFAKMLAADDRAVLAGPSAVRDTFLVDLAAASPTAARSAARDFRLFAQPWGFDLDEVMVPVAIWHGSDDRNVPVGHAEVLADLCRSARLHIVPGGGHLLLATHGAEIVADLRAGCGP